MTVKRYVVETGPHKEFAGLVNGFADLKQLQEDGYRQFSQFPYVLQDIFYVLYRERPRLIQAQHTSTAAKLNRFIIEHLLKSREYKASRRFTRQNVLGAGMAAMSIAGQVLSGLDRGLTETVNEIFTTEDELDDAELQLKVVRNIARVARDSLGRSCPAGQEGAGSQECAGTKDAAGLFESAAVRWEEVIDEGRKRLQSLSARLSLQWNTSGRKNIGSSGDAGQEGEKVRVNTGTEGLSDNKGIWTTGDLSAHLKNVDSYLASPKMKRLAQRVGRLKEVNQKNRGRWQAADETELRGIGYGSDLTMVVPEEWVEYFHPRRKKVFQKKYSEEALCLYDMTGPRRKGQGSLIICLDNSGSMQGPKEETSKAVAIALMEIAMTQKRDFVVIMFGGPQDEMKVFEIPGGRCTFDQLVTIGEHFLCSAGTDFEKPLQEAMRYLEKDKYPDGDIVFITDGVCHVSPEFLEQYRQRKKARRFKTLAVLVNYGHVSTAPVEAFADELLLSKDLKGLDVAGDLFQRMGNV